MSLVGPKLEKNTILDSTQIYLSLFQTQEISLFLYIWLIKLLLLSVLMFTLLLGFVVIDHRWWHQCLSRRRLKVSTFLAVTTEFGRLFHTSTTRFVKKFFLVSVLHRFFTSFSECPLVKLTGLFLSTGCRPLCSVSSLHQFQFLLRLWGWIRNCIANSDPSSNCLACVRRFSYFWHYLINAIFKHLRFFKIKNL